jgi:hypothetical protein
VEKLRFARHQGKGVCVGRWGVARGEGLLSVWHAPTGYSVVNTNTEQFNQLWYWYLDFFCLSLSLSLFPISLFLSVSVSLSLSLSAEV